MNDQSLQPNTVRRWKRYPAYKSSGIEWFGDVPEHWETRRLKDSVVSCRNGAWGEEPTGEADDIPCIRVADFDRRKLSVNQAEGLTIRSVDVSKKIGKVLQKGDLLIEKSGGGDLQPVGVVVLYELDIPAICSNFIARIETAKGYYSGFLRYLHASLYSARVNVRSINQSTGIQNLDSGSYLNEVISVPPLEEQKAIAGFLDRETARIDTLIERKQRLIELLEEKRQAVISHAVTRGLDPSAPMKDSGIPWLGMVPAHWEVLSLKYLAPMQAGYAFKSDSFGSEGVPVVRMNNLRRGYLDLEDCARIDESEAPPEFALHQGDVVLGLSGSLGETGSLGNFAVVRATDLPCYLNQRVGRFSARGNLMQDFLMYFIQSKSFTEPLIAGSEGTAQFNISTSDIGQLRIALPAISEQSRIVTELNRVQQRTTQITARIQAGIAYLQEYRAALISAAVTGAIDVRGEGEEK